jgi:hypothetical protein
MKKLILTAAIVIGVVAGMGRIGGAQTQTPANHPDFSGKWTVDIQASSPGVVLDGERLVHPFLVSVPTTLQPSFANAFIARQDSSTLRIQREMDRQVVTTNVTVSSYRLNGSETTNIEGAMTKTASRATWQDGRLTIVTRIANADGSLPRNKLERVMSLDASGRLLIETTNGLDPVYLTVYRRVQ